MNMTYTVVPTPKGTKAKAQTVPFNGHSYDYSFLKTLPKGAIAAIRVPQNRKPENIRRAVQITTAHTRNTSVLDSVLMVW